MPRPRYPHVHQQFGRKPANGGARPVMWYFRIGHGPRVRLRGSYGTPEFVAYYQHLLKGGSPVKERDGKRPDLKAAHVRALLKLAQKKTRSWKEFRYLALRLYGAKCQCCGVRPKSGATLHVDHIKPRSEFPELQWDLSNLQILCEDCNIGKGAWDQTDWRGLKKQHNGAAKLAGYAERPYMFP